MLNWFNLEQKNNIPLSHNHSPLPDRLGEFERNVWTLFFFGSVRSFVCFIKFNLHVFRKRETEKPREKREPEKPRIRVSSYTHKGLEARARRARAARGTNFVYYRFPLLPRPSFSGPQRMMISIITIVFCLSSQHKGNPSIERRGFYSYSINWLWCFVSSRTRSGSFGWIFKALSCVGLAWP